MSTRLFDVSIRDDIYAIYGLVRIADEIVDTYKGADAGMLLERLKLTTYEAMERGYDTNPIIHSFAKTAAHYRITKDLVHPFFESMKMDLEPHLYDETLYDRYIYGSAEVIGLMCLRVFCQNDDVEYERLLPGARALGSAYQKVNFLRDIAADYNDLGRLYFPGVSFETFNDESKKAIIDDIERDFVEARQYVEKLPQNSCRAVRLSELYYSSLLNELKKTPADALKRTRVRISNPKKLFMLAGVSTGLRK
jgi:phytoene/squalene synthetase